MNFVQKMCRYKAWANAKTFTALASLDQDEIYKPRQSCFASILSTLAHNYVIDDIFRAHLDGKQHQYRAKNTEQSTTLAELRSRVEDMDTWWIDYADQLDNDSADKVVNFTFVDGSKGAMTRQEMVLHTVNHSTYHRGYIDEMLYSISVVPPTTDYPAFAPVVGLSRD
ncbi:DinB family protein [Anderseniella sp. Alg231-50]|uniref:DinB family protein n=1 Tax=Anderseniella sp. Alg231-50 TaxID=1922226 RepID=UPI000D55A011